MRNRHVAAIKDFSPIARLRKQGSYLVCATSNARVAFPGSFKDVNEMGAGYDMDAYIPGEEPRDPWDNGIVNPPARPLNVDAPANISALQDELASELQITNFQGKQEPGNVTDLV